MTDSNQTHDLENKTVSIYLQIDRERESKDLMKKINELELINSKLLLFMFNGRLFFSRSKSTAN